jgi:hypothetical protein
MITRGATGPDKPADDAWLRSQRDIPAEKPSVDAGGPQSVTGSQSRVETASSDPAGGGASPTEQAEASRLRAEEALRRQIPPSVLIELSVWRQAKVNGLVLLVIGLATCLPVLAIAFGFLSWEISRVWTAPLYLVIVLATPYLLYTAWHEARIRGVKMRLSDIDDGPLQKWETLPEIVSLRAGGKRYRLLGEVLIASPFFEIVVVLFVITLVVASFSRNTSPLYNLLGERFTY